MEYMIITYLDDSAFPWRIDKKIVRERDRCIITTYGKTLVSRWDL